MATISKIKNGSTNYQLVGSPRYATCTTAAGTVAKVAALADSTSALTLEAGVRICVKFSNANTAASPTLNVASTGAKAIYWHGAALASGQYWQANAVLDFLYNGTQWELVGVAKDNNTTYSNFVKSGSGAKAGLVPAPSTTAGTTKYLREDGTWQVPPDTNTTYTFATGDNNGQIKVTPSGGSAQNISVKGLGSAAYTASTAYATAAQGTLASNALPKSGGTMTGNITMDNSSSAQSGEPYIQWATVSSNKPYTGFAHDQSDGTFIICSMEKDTTTNGVKYYRNGLAIGGGSGNLFWKGAKVATVNDIPTLSSLGGAPDDHNHDDVYAPIDSPKFTTSITLGSRFTNSEIGTNSTALGIENTASGNYAFAHGAQSHATGNYSFAVNGSTASGQAAFSEGADTTASGNRSHAEGKSTVAGKESSHAEGYYTIANSKYQHVQGKYNIEDAADTYAHIVGAGTGDSARSNAHTLDWNGNAWFKGDVYVGGTNQTTGSSKLVKSSDLSSYAPKASPALTGTPTAPTAAAGTNTTQIATTAFVTTAVSNGKGSKIVTSSTQPTGLASGDYWYKII